MKNKDKTKEQLIKEVTELRQRIAELERAESRYEKGTERRSEEELRDIINSAKDGIVLLDLTGKVTAINKSVTEITGYTEEDILGKRFKVLKMFPPKSIAIMLTAFTRVISGQQPLLYEVEVYTRTGEKLSVEIHGSLFRRGEATVGVVAVLRDITERKQLEALLLRERDTFVTILQHALYGVVLLDRDGNHVFVNPAFTAITGYTLEDVSSGRDWLHKAYPDKVYRKQVAKFWEKDRRIGVTRREISIVCKNGKTKEIEFKPTVLDDGRAVVMVADVTERKRAEEELQRHREDLEKSVAERTAALQAVNEQLQREITERKGTEEALQKAYGDLKVSAERYRSLVDNVDLGIILIDSDYNISMVNTTLKRDLQKAAHELIGKKCFREFELRDVVCPHCPGVQAMATGKPSEVEVDLLRDDVKHIHVRLQAFPVYGDDGTVTGFIEVAEDITERKRIQDELQKSEEKYRELFKGMNDTAWVIDFNGKFIDVNDAAVEVLGYSREELLSMGPHDIDSSLDSGTITGLIKEMQKDKIQVFETTHITKDGKVMPVEIKSSLMTYQGKSAILSIARDITERKRMEEAVREGQKELQAFMDASPIAISWGDLEGNIQYINRKHHELFGYSLEEIPTVAEWRRRADQDPLQRKRFAHWEEELVEAHEYGRSLPPRGMTVTCKDGSVRYVMVEGTIVSNHRLVIYNDITERKRMEEELRESEKRFRLLVEHSKDAFILHDLDGRIIDINQHACDSLGYTREELLGLSIEDIDDEVVVGKHKEMWHKMFPGVPLTLEGIHRRKDGATFPAEIRLVAFNSGGSRLILGLVRDITERKRTEETIRKLAYHDALTELPNRALFADRLNQAIAQADRKQSKLAVMLLDLDHFKNVNDTLGHSMGDQLLISVGKRLTEILRQEDTISRIGGDEFCLLLPEVDRVQDAATIAQKVLKAFHKPFVLDVHDLTITTSIGVAMYPDDGEAVKTLLKNADVALYQAKQKGRDNFQRYASVMKPEF